MDVFWCLGDFLTRQRQEGAEDGWGRRGEKKYSLELYTLFQLSRFEKIVLHRTVWTVQLFLPLDLCSSDVSSSRTTRRASSCTIGCAVRFQNLLLDQTSALL